MFTSLFLPVEWLLSLIVLLPLGSFLALIGGGSRLPRRGDWLALLATGGAFGGALLLLSAGSSALVVHWAVPWFDLPGGKGFRVGFVLDPLARLMLALVTFISLLVQVFSVGYMRGERHYARYFAYLGLFTFAMLGLVLADSLLLMYGFWELVGVSSYLLIGFWYDRPKAAAASKKAFLFNRVGDAGFLIGILLLYAHVGTTDWYSGMEALRLEAITNAGWLTVAGLCLFSGCVGKSAQFPLSGWLPDAMEGPTPVSALIHAATMVAAGIFLLARVHGLLTEDARTVIAAVGALTAFTGAYAALFQNDVKKVLAFSTVSQLGLMVVGMGTGASGAALFHLFTHACFKAGLFLAVGAVIHAVHHAAVAAQEPERYAAYDTHDMRRMGGLRHTMPLTFWCYLLAASSLVGLPLFSGFLSKDALLEAAVAWASARQGGYWLVPVTALGVTLLTAFYTGRQLCMVFFGSWRGAKDLRSHLHEVPLSMRVPLLALAGLSVGVAFSFRPFDPSAAWVWPWFPPHEATPLSPVPVPLLASLLAVLGLGLAYGQFRQKEAMRKLDFRRQLPDIRQRFIRYARTLQPVDWLYRLSVNNWYFEAWYQHGVVRPLLVSAAWLQRFDRRIVDGGLEALAVVWVVAAHVLSWLDRTVVDGAVNGAAISAGWVGRLTRATQSGRVQTYVLLALLSLVCLAFWIVL